MKKTALLYLLAGLFLAIPTPSYAQKGGGGGDNTEDSQDGDDEKSNTEESDDHKRFWQASLPGGHYMVAIDRIASISMHEYLLDEQLIVHEVVVDTNGRGLARFYHVVTVAENSNSATARELVAKGKELLDKAGQKAGTDVKDMVQKNYPTTSHAGMVEYRLMDLRDLNALYKSLKNAWETGKGRKITVKE
ncbi:hypothetical protein [Luteolibacter soli]|uniref:DUF4468 domain-containing protein n=1 Tax=Luteolibacter soli TaxID=3135280 RepID=A0ABU9AXA9_9BACT